MSKKATKKEAEDVVALLDDMLSEEETKTKKTAKKATKKVKKEDKVKATKKTAKKATKKVAKKADVAVETDAKDALQTLIDLEPKELRLALTELTQKKRNFIRRQIDKVDVRINGDDVDAGDAKAGDKIKVEAKLAREIYIMKKSGEMKKRVYATYKAVADTLKENEDVIVAVFEVIGTGKKAEHLMFKEYKKVINKGNRVRLVKLDKDIFNQ